MICMYVVGARHRCHVFIQSHYYYTYIPIIYIYVTAASRRYMAMQTTLWYNIIMQTSVLLKSTL